MQVVNVCVKEALDEFAQKWVEEDILRLLGNNPEDITDDATMQTLLEGTGQNLRKLVENVADLVGHFVSFE